MTAKELPVLTFDDHGAWDRWLAGYATASAGLWLKLAKAGAPRKTLTKREAIEGALRHGWIDGQLAKHDEHYFRVRFTPRRPGSKWSAINAATAERLIKAWRMTAAGLREVEAAKADGRWAAAYAPQSKAQPPADLKAALAAAPAAKRLFEELDSANRYAVIYRVQDAKKPETRARRIAQYVDMLARGATLHPRKSKKKSSAARD
jgi:uncharacterized protein YdeI (YjbR/CyaY-like superfamily)